MGARLVIDRCMVKGVRSFKSEKSGKTYDNLVISIGVDDMELGCGDFDLSTVPTLVPVSFDAQIAVRRFGVRQTVELTGAAPNIKVL